MLSSWYMLLFCPKNLFQRGTILLVKSEFYISSLYSHILPKLLFIYGPTICEGKVLSSKKPSTLSLILKNKDTDQISLFFAEAQQSCLLPCSLRAGCTKLDCTLQKPHIGKLWRKIPSRLRTHLGSYRSSERREKYRSPWCEMHVIHLLHNRQPKRL